MMPYQVLDVKGPREWAWPEGSDQINHDYVLTIDGEVKPAILTQKPNTPPPSPGPMDLTLEPHPRFADRLKAKRVRQFQPGGGGRGMSPEERAKVQRMHSQEMSLRAVELALTAGVARADTKADLFKMILDTADWFDRDVNKQRTAS